MNKNHLRIIWILLLPVLLVTGLRLLALARQATHLDKIAVEMASVGQYRLGLFPNHSGSALIFQQETNKGLGTFLCETATGKTRLLFEEKEKGYKGRFRLLGWSADDNVLMFANMSDDTESNGSGAITICNGMSGEVTGRIPADSYARDSQFAWLTPKSFVYSSVGHRSWLIYAQKPDGTWVQTQVVKRFADGRLPNLIGVSPVVIAWQKTNTVWTYDFHNGQMRPIWTATTNRITGLQLSEKSGNILVKCRDSLGNALLELRLPSSGNTECEVVNVIRPLPEEPRAEVDESGGRFTYKLTTGLGGEQAAFVWEGQSRYYAFNGSSLFFAGSRGNEVPGIWQYELASKNLRRVVSASNTPIKWAMVSPGLPGIFTNKFGKVITYHFWQPIQKRDGVKYPVVIGKYLNVWNPFQQIAANAGWYFVTIDLTDWGMSAFSQEMAELHEEITKSLAIDTNRFIVIASSAQAPGVDELYLQNLGLAGFIFYHPAGITDLPFVKNRNLLILGGTDDTGEKVETLEKAQDKVFKNGNAVRLLIQEGVQHNMNRSLDSEIELCREFARFLNEN